MQNRDPTVPEIYQLERPNGLARTLHNAAQVIRYSVGQIEQERRFNLDSLGGEYPLLDLEVVAEDLEKIAEWLFENPRAKLVIPVEGSDDGGEA